MFSFVYKMEWETFHHHFNQQIQRFLMSRTERDLVIYIYLFICVDTANNYTNYVLCGLRCAEDRYVTARSVVERNEWCCQCHVVKSNQIRFYLYSTFKGDFWSSQSAVHVIKTHYYKSQ